MNMNIFLKKLVFEVYLIYSMIIYVVQQSDSVIHIYIHILFHISFHYDLS